MSRPKNKKFRKAVKDSTLPPTAPSETEPAKFPLNRMPVELVHMICGYLNPVEVASIRIISGTIAAIGLEYIATTVTLSLEENSFDRLVEIAHQPVISKYVYSLHYEHDFLTRLTCEEWENTIRTPEHTAALNGDSRIRAPNFDASERALRLFHRKHAVLKARNTYGKKRLDQAFLMYQRHCAEQDCTRRSGFFSNKLTHALQHLPNLRTIHMPAYGSYSRYRMEIGNLLEGAFFDQPTIKSDNVGVTPSVLLAVDQAVRGAQNMNTRATSSGHVAALSAISRNQSKAIGNDAAGSSQVSASPRGRTPDSGCSRRNDLGSSNRRVLRIEDFRSESLNWSLLLEEDEIFTSMKRSICNLTQLVIHLIHECWIKETESRYRYADDIVAPRECLRRGRLYEFIKSASYLEELNVSFALTVSYPNTCLTDVVGSFHWVSLKTVHFRRINISNGSLELFCSRHSSTLSDLSLGDLQMGGSLSHSGRDEDLWYSVFLTVREATKLKEASVYGNFEIFDRWCMDDHCDVRPASGTLIGRYLVGDGGNSSLKDFLKEERSRIAMQEAKSVSNIDDVLSTSDSTSAIEHSSSESDA